VYDARTGAEAFTLQGPQGLGALAFSPDGSRIAAGASLEGDGAVRVYDARTGAEILALKSLKGASPSAPVFSPDGTRIAVAPAPSKRGDGVVRVYDAPPDTTSWQADRRKALMDGLPSWHRTQAIESDQSGQWFASAFHWGWLAKAESTMGQPHFRRGLALTFLAKTAEAKTEFETALALKKDLGESELAGIHARLGHWEEVAKIFQKGVTALKPGMIIVLGIGKPTTGTSPSLCYVWDGKNQRPPLLFSRGWLGGGVYDFTVARNGQQFYHNAYSIIQVDKSRESKFFTHNTLVRDLVLDDSDNVYFSEATEGLGDGKIYRVQLAKGDTAATAELVCAIPLRHMGIRNAGGSWAGNFAFGRTANGGLDTDTLYLSSGNQVPAAIFRMTRKDGEWGKPQQVFEAEREIKGLVFTEPGVAFFVSDNQVFRLTDLKKAEAVLTLPDVSRLHHVSVVPEAPGEKTDK
jgi:hypothetical protein